MKKVKKELEGKTVKELEKQTQVLRVEIAKLVLNRKVSPAKDTNLIVKKRKQLAVVLTVLTEKQYEENPRR